MSEGSVAAQLRKMFDLHMKKHDRATSFAISIVKSDVLAMLATQRPKTRIRVLNDTSKELTLRRPPTVHKVQPQKMTLEFIEGNEVFLKIWDGNVVLLSKDELGVGVEEQQRGVATHVCVDKQQLQDMIDDLKNLKIKNNPDCPMIITKYLEELLGGGVEAT